MHAGRRTIAILYVLYLIVKENVGLEFPQHPAFFNAAEEEYFVDIDAPFA